MGGKIAEVFDPADGWSKLANITPEPILTDDWDGVYRADNHGWFFGWSDGLGVLYVPIRKFCMCMRHDRARFFHNSGMPGRCTAGAPQRNADQMCTLVCVMRTSTACNLHVLLSCVRSACLM